MNSIASSHIQETIEGSMSRVPRNGQLQCIVKRNGEALRWSAAALKCCFSCVSPIASAATMESF
eukprot:4608637-Karenia_brevis.AAC.1